MGKKSKKTGKSSALSSPKKDIKMMEDQTESPDIEAKEEKQTKSIVEEAEKFAPSNYKKPSSVVELVPGIHRSLLLPSRKALGVYSQLTKHQIDMLREIFLLIDEDGDGIISEEDLKNAFKIVNKQVSNEDIESMFNTAQDPLTFGGFLSLLASGISDLSSKDELETAFEVFQSKGDDEMKCNYDDLTDNLVLSGMKKEEIDEIFKSFIKTGMDGSRTLLAQRFISILSDD